MYTAVLMLAMVGGSEAIDHGRGGCCSGYSGGCSGYYGGCSGYHGGCYSSGYYGGCSGYYGGGCCGSTYSRSGYYGMSGNYGTPMYASGQTYYPQGAVVQGPGTEIRQSNYFDPNNGAAMINVLVPNADAEIWFDGTVTKQRGTERMFYSPTLQPGNKYNYTIRARWTENGKEVSHERRVEVQPGQPVNVDFRAATKGEKGENVPNPKGK